MHKQIKDLFTNPVKAMMSGLWYSGIEGEGEYKQWHDNGKLQEHAFHKNGFRDGEFKQWFFSGQLEIHCFFKNNKIDGEYKRWNDRGKLIYSATYDEGEVV